MVIHTPTFLNIFKRYQRHIWHSSHLIFVSLFSPHARTAHLRCWMWIPSPCFTLFPISFCLPTCGRTRYTVLPFFYVFLCALLCFLTFVFWNLKYYFLFHPEVFTPVLSRWAVIVSAASGYLLISALIVPVCVHPNLTSQLYIYW